MSASGATRSVTVLATGQGVPTYTLRSGELVGEGCAKSLNYLWGRVRQHCDRQMKGLPEHLREARSHTLDLLLAEIGRSQFWTSRNGSLVEAVCRDAYEHVIASTPTEDYDL